MKAREVVLWILLLIMIVLSIKLTAVRKVKASPGTATPQVCGCVEVQASSVPSDMGYMIRQSCFVYDSDTQSKWLMVTVSNRAVKVVALSPTR
jgi:hypothetical protein